MSGVGIVDEGCADLRRPLWVKSRHSHADDACPLWGRNRTSRCALLKSAKCQSRHGVHGLTSPLLDLAVP